MNDPCNSVEAVPLVIVVTIAAMRFMMLERYLYPKISRRQWP